MIGICFEIRFRRLQWRVKIQDYSITVVQNIQLLIAQAWPKPRAALALGMASGFTNPETL
jgi:hypothetical protein